MGRTAGLGRTIWLGEHCAGLERAGSWSGTMRIVVEAREYDCVHCSSDASVWSLGNVS